jgi:hypothetical protein
VTNTGSAISLEPGFAQATRDALLALGGADARREGTVIVLPRARH